MKKSKLICAALIGALAFTGLTACSDNNKKDDTHDSDVVTEEKKDDEEKDVVKDEEDKNNETDEEYDSTAQGVAMSYITCQYISDDFEAQLPEDHAYYEDSTSENAKKVLFTADNTVGIKYVEVETSIDENGEIVFSDMTYLAEFDEISPINPLVIQMDMPEGAPTRLIYVVNEDESTDLYYIMESTTEDAPQLVEVKAVG